VRFVEPDEAAQLFPPIWSALHAQRPGVFERDEAWWTLRRLRVPDEEASNPKRLVLLELDGEPQGYAIFKLALAFEAGVSASTLEVSEAIAASPQAWAELWRFLLDIDWQATIKASLLPPDHPLFLLLANPRRMAYRMGDGLWVRLVDVGAALSGRAYAGSGSLVFDVRDAVCPWNEGRWRVSPDGASRVDGDADITLDVSALGSAYLGAVSFSQLRAALRLEEISQGAVERADAVFAWRPLPWCPEIF
jgi:predicted acetyltransferase